MIKTVARTLTLACATIAAVVLVPANAGAVSHDISSWESARCGINRPGNNFCLFYSPGAKGAMWGYAGQEVSNLGSHRFWANTGAGSGQVVRNNAASAENDSNCNVGIWYSPGFAGDSNWLKPWHGGNLKDYLRNNEASIKMSDGSRPGCPV